MEGSEGGKKKKEERKQNNWFCRHLERVQTGHREPQSVNGAHGIETVAFRVLGFSTFVWQFNFYCKKKEKRQKLHLTEIFTGTLHPSVLFAEYLLSLLLSQELLSVRAFEFFWSELPLIVP